ncbi:hypothetical protein C8J38_105204 [Rhizobium sp. PP-WC-2G-219]|nr:hypothetical protein C8J38_105204 [Rhizobium sp. PP-WC-2G-219]
MKQDASQTGSPRLRGVGFFGRPNWCALRWSADACDPLSGGPHGIEFGPSSKLSLRLPFSPNLRARTLIPPACPTAGMTGGWQGVRTPHAGRPAPAFFTLRSAAGGSDIGRYGSTCAVAGGLVFGTQGVTPKSAWVSERIQKWWESTGYRASHGIMVSAHHERTSRARAAATPAECEPHTMSVKRHKKEPTQNRISREPFDEATKNVANMRLRREYVTARASDVTHAGTLQRSIPAAQSIPIWGLTQHTLESDTSYRSLHG